ncbi:hypothetical protein DP106_15100 [Halonotius pteroides]|uniref:Uncharacterized protein n=1 Tax=Halonotius pteroides TaxID=268735 RepID=A0A3A6QJS5_9EURY|nr:hypothetical protein DP106_15100 [Halonotius pteroides]
MPRLSAIRWLRGRNCRHLLEHLSGATHVFLFKCSSENNPRVPTPNREEQRPVRSGFVYIL